MTFFFIFHVNFVNSEVAPTWRNFVLLCFVVFLNKLIGRRTNMLQVQVQRYNSFPLVLKFQCFNIDLFQNELYGNIFQYIYLILVFRIGGIFLGVCFANFWFFFCSGSFECVECLVQGQNFNLLQLGFFVSILQVFYRLLTSFY